MWDLDPLRVGHVRKHLIYFEVCFLTLVNLINWLRHSDKVRDTPRSYQFSHIGLKSVIP